MGFRECCSSFFAGLPDPALPLLPSFLLGTSFAAAFLFCVYKKQTNMSLKDIAVDMGKTLFCLFPSHDLSNHSEMIACQNPSCVRCRKYREQEIQLIRRFEDMKLRNVKLITSRIEDAIQLVKAKCRRSFKSEGDFSARKLENRSSSSSTSFQKPTIFFMDLAANPYWNDFDVYTMETELLKLNFKVIMGEFQEVFDNFQSGNSNGWKLNEIPSGHWCIYPFIDQGVVSEANCKRCPNTATMVGSLPSVMKDCIFGNACFSILYPDSQIEPHHGPTNLRLRCHLGLSIPNGCWLEVAGKQHRWEDQQTVVFDDSFEHSASFINQPSSAHSMPRAILMIDFWHPDVSADEKKVLLELLAP